MTYPAPFTTGVYADALGDIRTWARAHPYLTPLVNGRVFFRIPDKPTFPLVRLYRAGGANQAGEAPIEDVIVGWDIWGGAYSDVVAIGNAIKAACHLLPSGTHLGTTTVVLNADVTGDIDTPDPDTGNARKTLTSTFTVRPVTAHG